MQPTWILESTATTATVCREYRRRNTCRCQTAASTDCLVVGESDTGQSQISLITHKDGTTSAQTTTTSVAAASAYRLATLNGYVL